MGIPVTVYCTRTQGIYLIGIPKVLTISEETPSFPIARHEQAIVSQANWAQRNPGIRPNGMFSDQVVFAIGPSSARDLDLLAMKQGEYWNMSLVLESNQSGEKP